MFSPTLTWAVSGFPTFLKGSGAVVNGPEILAAYFQWAADTGIPEGIEAGMHRLAQAMERYAQSEAPWTDVTGQARQGLHAEVVREGNRFIVILQHGVDYGIWLEVRYNGRDGIVLRTQEVFAGRVEDLLSGEIQLALDGRGSKFRHAGSGRFA